MSNKLEQSSETITEIIKIANEQLSPEHTLPIHVTQCIELVKVPDLDSPHEIDVRCFYLQDGRVFFATVFFETVDSFLVGASARMVMEQNKEIICEPVCPMPVLRVFKNSISMITKPLSKYKYHYYLYMRDGGAKILPEYITGTNLKNISDFIQTYNGEDDSIQNYSSTNLNKDEFERKEIPGVSEDAFYPYVISEKIH